VRRDFGFSIALATLGRKFARSIRLVTSRRNKLEQDYRSTLEECLRNSAAFGFTSVHRQHENFAFELSGSSVCSFEGDSCRDNDEFTGLWCLVTFERIGFSSVLGTFSKLYFEISGV
jgi:hypothetical protein